MILLTKEEIERAYRRKGYGSPHVNVLDPRGVAKAQLKKVVEWGETPCMEHLNGVTARKCCAFCIKALKKEIE